MIKESTIHSRQISGYCITVELEGNKLSILVYSGRSNQCFIGQYQEEGLPHLMLLMFGGLSNMSKYLGSCESTALTIHKHQRGQYLSVSKGIEEFDRQMTFILDLKIVEQADKQQTINRFREKIANFSKQAKIFQEKDQLFWDEEIKSSKHYEICGRKLKMIQFPTSASYIVSRDPIPSQKINIYTLKLFKYGNPFRWIVCFGIVTAKKPEEIYEFSQNTAIFYMSDPRSQSDMKGCIMQNMEVVLESPDLYIPEGGQLDITVDLIDFQIEWSNKKTQKKCVTKIREEYRGNQFYIFAELGNIQAVAQIYVK